MHPRERRFVSLIGVSLALAASMACSRCKIYLLQGRFVAKSVVRKEITGPGALSGTLVL